MCLVLEVGKVYVNDYKNKVKIVWEDTFSREKDNWPFLGVDCGGKTYWFDRSGHSSEARRIFDLVGQAPTPHPHAESMMMYAQDAAECEKPWLRWEYKFKDNASPRPTVNTWRPMGVSAPFYTELEYRRLPQSEWPPEAC